MNRLNSIQALRGLASVMVVLFHLHEMVAAFGYRSPGLSFFRWFGFAGVDLFFVISGFIITYSNRNSLGRAVALPGFLFRRLWRIYPAYWCAYAIAIAVAMLMFGRQILLSNNAADLARWLALLPGLDNQFAGQAWTLTYELMFYFGFGLLMLLPRRGAKPALACWAAAVATVMCFGDTAWLPLQPLVLEFLGGCGIAWLAVRGRTPHGRLAVCLGIAWAAAAILLVNRFEPAPFGSAMTSHRLRVLTFGPPAVLIVYGCVATEGTWRVPRSMVQLGEASYSLYLTHPSIVILGKYVGYFLPHAFLPHLVWWLGTLAAAIAFSFAFHYAVERPLLACISRRSDPSQSRGRFRFSLPLFIRKISSRHRV
ncbi:MAG: acyltransferase [Gemmataceae bacterium]